MKDSLVRLVRKVVPSGAVRPLEEVYRRGRAWVVAARYGFPAKNLRVIAVTGTNGKTTTAHFINSILKASGAKTALFSTATIEMAGESKLNDLNATVALTAQMQAFFAEAKRQAVDWVIIEAPSHALDQHKLDFVPIECAIMTNLTQDHLDYHKTMEAYAAVKAKLFQRQPRFVVLNRDDQWYDYFKQFPATEMTITYGTDKAADCRIAKVGLHRQGTDASLIIDHQTKLQLGTVLTGRFNVYNLAAAVAATYVLHIDLAAIEEGVENLAGVPGRQQKVDTGQPYDIIVDYAHTPDALQQLLETEKHLTKNRLILVFGATGDRDKTKRPIMGEIAATLADRIFVTEEESYNEDPATIRRMIMQGISHRRADAKTEEIADRRAAIEKALSIARPGDTVLITGMGHEQFRIVNGRHLPWNDAAVVREILQPQK